MVEVEATKAPALCVAIGEQGACHVAMCLDGDHWSWQRNARRDGSVRDVMRVPIEIPNQSPAIQIPGDDGAGVL